MKFPPLLHTGARVGLVAPAGRLRGPEDVDKAIASVRRMSCEPVVGDHVLDQLGYLAGTDADRLADFNRFAGDDAIDAVWCIRGGFGAMRLLDGIDYDAWKRRPKTLIGYSDITALHAAIGARAGLVTFHGPTAREEGSEFSTESLGRAVVRGVDSCGVAAAGCTLVGGTARGRLAGGNLALLCALSGTPYAPSLEGAILVLEDVSEQVYRIDRMLTHLRLTGALARVAGIAFGQFTDIPADAGNERRSLETVLREVAESLRVPCIAGIPMGHVREQWTIPLGAMAELNADERKLAVGSRV
jgi:muramoyltetrapeptide carboxypeptidase